MIQKIVADRPAPPSGRLDAMRQLLLWEGQLRRSRLLELFDLKPTRASQWIAEFAAQFPSWTRWDPRARAHVVTDQARREEACGQTGSERAQSLGKYLAITGGPLHANVERGDGIVWSAFPELVAPKTETFSLFHQAIERAAVVSTSYCSLREPEPHRRTLSPHSLVRAGRRWHVRAYCEETADFRDFNLGRFTEHTLTGALCAKTAADDEQWGRYLQVELIAHPALTTAQRQVVEREYFQAASRHVAQCRVALLPYFLAEVHATLNPVRDGVPEWLLAVANAEEVGQWMLR